MGNQDINRKDSTDQNRTPNQGSQQRDQRSGGMNQPNQGSQRSGNVDQSRKDQDFTANE
jgi:hypothetical protein